MKRAATAAAILVLAGCAAPSDGGGRNLKYGLFYDIFRPESSRRQELLSKLDRPPAPEIDEAYDIGKIRAARQYSEVPENYELRDWKDGVLLQADANLLKLMREDTAAKVGALEGRLSGLNAEPVTISKGRIEPVRHRLDIERLKLEAIDDRLAQLE